jgi:hypothetical protein
MIGETGWRFRTVSTACRSIRYFSFMHSYCISESSLYDLITISIQYLLLTYKHLYIYHTKTKILFKIELNIKVLLLV